MSQVAFSLQLVAAKVLICGTAAGRAAAALVHLGHNGARRLLELLELRLEVLRLGGLVLVEPLDGLVDGRLDGLEVVLGQLRSRLLVLDDRVLQRVDALLEEVARVDAVLGLLVLLGELLRLADLRWEGREE